MRSHTTQRKHGKTPTAIPLTLRHEQLRLGSPVANAIGIAAAAGLIMVLFLNAAVSA